MTEEKKDIGPFLEEIGKLMSHEGVYCFKNCPKGGYVGKGNFFNFRYFFKISEINNEVYFHENKKGIMERLHELLKEYTLNGVLIDACLTEAKDKNLSIFEKGCETHPNPKFAYLYTLEFTTGKEHGKKLVERLEKITKSRNKECTFFPID